MGAEAVGHCKVSKRPGASQRTTWEGTVCQGWGVTSCACRGRLGGGLCMSPAFLLLTVLPVGLGRECHFHFAAAEAKGQLSVSFLGSCAGVWQSLAWTQP